MKETTQITAGDAADSPFPPPLTRQKVTICSLSTELLVDIFSYLEETDSKLPSWQLWLTYRRVNQRFRDVVEMLYIQRYLRRSAVVANGNARGESKGGLCSKGRWATEFYDFASFCCDSTVEGRWDRLAVFRRREEQVASGVKKQGATEVLKSEQLLCLPVEHNYHPDIIMQIETGATDLLPSDFRWVSSDDEKGGAFVFDWRLYFCGLFAEIQQSAALLEAHVLKRKQICRHVWQMCQESDQICLDNDDNESENKMSLVQLSTSLYTQDQDQTDPSTSPTAPDAAATPIRTVANPGVYDLTTLSVKSISRTPTDITQDTAEGDEDDHQFLSSHARARLILAAGTYDIGCDGRYREVRRQRRRRIWRRQQGCNVDDKGIRNESEEENEEQRNRRTAFERYGEGRVARKLLVLSVDMEKMRRTVTW